MNDVFAVVEGRERWERGRKGSHVGVWRGKTGLGRSTHVLFKYSQSSCCQHC